MKNDPDICPLCGRNSYLFWGGHFSDMHEELYRVIRDDFERRDLLINEGIHTTISRFAREGTLKSYLTELAIRGLE